MRVIAACGLLLLGLGACSDDDDSLNGSDSGAQGSNAGAGAGGASGSTGTGGQAGRAGSAGGVATMGGTGGRGSGTAGDSAGSGSAGSAGRGTGGSDGGASGAGSGRTCGTRGAGPCPDGEYCEFPADADCGRADAPGECAAQPSICTREYRPVCGCDGMTYSNACTAASAGVSVESEGECGSARAELDCDPRNVVCDEQPGACPDGQVRALDGSCYGDCVAIEACACDGPQACPDADHYTCHMSAGRCGPYV